MNSFKSEFQNTAMKTVSRVSIIIAIKSASDLVSYICEESSAICCTDNITVYVL